MAARILIVEDNEANLALVEYLLKAAGYEILTAADGAQGMRSAQESRPDLIICDIQLPGMSGYEVLEQIRADPVLKDTPVIALTAFSMPNDRSDVLEAGFNCYLSKPIEPEKFRAQIEACLDPALRSGVPAFDC
jgi:CheY-like chemotaxis protein